MDYRTFIINKSQMAEMGGFEPTFDHPKAFDFQTCMTHHAIRHGRFAMMEDCGLGKTLQAFTWGENVIRRRNKPVLVLSPLMVSMQMVDEAEKFGFEAERSRDGSFKSGAKLVLTNYENLHKFDASEFGGVVCDESSCIKNFDGARKSEITEFMRLAEYRLLCSATPAPNDYIELGTSSEALGQLGYMDMLGQFFKNDEDSLHPMFRGSKWRFKHHAEHDFWRWVCSWARAMRRPSDMGFDDGKYVLPELVEQEHVLESPVPEDKLFASPATNLAEEREERRRTIVTRCERAGELLHGSDSGIAWCHLNDEADTLTDIIPGSRQIKGADCDEEKEEALTAFKTGQIKFLVTKPKIAAFGLNFQHSAHMTYFADHSFEQYYQAVRRMYRFGQERSVKVDVIATEGLAGVTRNLRRKREASEAMFEQMIDAMNDVLKLKRYHDHKMQEALPSWLS